MLLFTWDSHSHSQENLEWKSSDHLASKHRSGPLVPGFFMNMVQAEAAQEGKAEGSAVSKKGPPLLLPAQDSLAKEWSLLHNLQKCLLWLGGSMQELGLFYFPLIYLSQVLKARPTSFLFRKPFELFVSVFFTELRVSAINSLRAFWGSEIWSLALCSWDSGHSSLTLYGMKSESYFEKSDFSKQRKNKTSNLNATECSLSYLKA